MDKFDSIACNTQFVTFLPSLCYYDSKNSYKERVVHYSRVVNTRLTEMQRHFAKRNSGTQDDFVLTPYH